MKKLLTFALFLCILFSFVAMTASALFYEECICTDCCCDCDYVCECEPVICSACEADFVGHVISDQQLDVTSLGYSAENLFSTEINFASRNTINIPTIISDNVRLNN